MKKPFERIITIMFENQYRSYVIQNPFLKKLAKAGADMTNYFGAFHPSQTNYLASFAGEVCGVTNDTPPASLPQKNLVDLLEEKKVSWKAYMEAYPNAPFNSPIYNDGAPIDQFPPNEYGQLSRYYRKHNAFATFASVQEDPKRWSNIVSDHEFWKVVNTKDTPGKDLPSYSWFTPDIWNDGHYLYNTHIDTNPRTQLVPQVAHYLEHIFFGTKIKTSELQGGYTTETGLIGLNLDIDLLLTDPQKAYQKSNIPKGTLIVVTFDEADYDAQTYDTMYDGPNQIYTVLLGDMIPPGTVIDTPYNHYNLIRTVQKNFGLSSLEKNDEGANWFRFLWNESFSWDATATATNFKAGSSLAITSEPTGNHLVFSEANGQLYESFQTQSGWSEQATIPLTTKYQIAFTTIGNTSFLVFKKEKGDLAYMTYDLKSKVWSASTDLNVSTDGSFDVFCYKDVKAKEQKLMLCWQGASNYIQSMQGSEKGFSGTTIPVGQLTDGAMQLGQLGASLFLVYKERNTRKMRITSYNTGDFNAFKAHDFNGNPAPQNNTTLYQWSVSDFEVGHFSKKFAAQGDVYQHLGHLAMATANGEMHLVHRAGYSDMTNGLTCVFGLTGIYSSENELTNGYGTLDQAGWTKEQKLSQVSFDVNAPIAMSSDGKTLTFVWIDSQNTIQYISGSYQ